MWHLLASVHPQRSQHGNGNQQGKGWHWSPATLGSIDRLGRASKRSKARMAGNFLGRKGYGRLILVGNGNQRDTGIPCQSQSQQDSSIQLGT